MYKSEKKKENPSSSIVQNKTTDKGGLVLEDNRPKTLQLKKQKSLTQAPDSPFQFQDNRSKTVQRQKLQENFNNNSSKTPVQLKDTIVRGNEEGVIQRIKSDAVVQFGRDIYPDNRPQNGLDVMPTLSFEEYASHVELRTIVFFATIMKARKLVMDSNHVPQPSLFTDHASAQIGLGMRGQPGLQQINTTDVPKSDKIDAAHRMNTTLIVNNATALGISAQMAFALSEVSAGTSQQFQASNITSDKIIDKYQTDFKNEILKSSTTSLTTKDFLKHYLFQYLTGLKKALEEKRQENPIQNMQPSDKDYIKAHSYQTAYLVISSQLDNFGTTLDRIWLEV